MILFMIMRINAFDEKKLVTGKQMNFKMLILVHFLTKSNIIHNTVIALHTLQLNSSDLH